MAATRLLKEDRPRPGPPAGDHLSCDKMQLPLCMYELQWAVSRTAYDVEWRLRAVRLHGRDLSAAARAWTGAPTLRVAGLCSGQAAGVVTAGGPAGLAS